MNNKISEKTKVRLEFIAKYKSQGMKNADIIRSLGMTDGSYYRLLKYLDGRKEMKTADDGLTYAPENKPKAVPVQIKGKKYLDVTSFWT